MNPADITLALTMLGLIGIGLFEGLVGLGLLAAATVLAVFIAGVAALLVGGEAPLSSRSRALVIPVAFFMSFLISGGLLLGFSRGIRKRKRRSPVALLDRLLGAALGAVGGVLVLSLIVYALLGVRFQNPVTREVKKSAFAPLLLDGGRQMVGLAGGTIPSAKVLADRMRRAGEKLKEELQKEKSPVETRAFPPLDPPAAGG